MKDPMELMLEHPEREFTYHYGRGGSKRKGKLWLTVKKLKMRLSRIMWQK